MSLAIEDRLAVEDLVKLHGHVVDRGAWDRLHEIFHPTAVLDLSAFGAGVIEGTEAIRDAALALGDRNPVAHHVTNIVVYEDGAGILALSKGFGVRSDGTAGSVDYEDRIHRTDAGWRIVHRIIRARTVPLRSAP